MLQIFIQVQSIGFLMEPAGETGRGDELDLLLDDVAVAPPPDRNPPSPAPRRCGENSPGTGAAEADRCCGTPSMTVRVSLQIS